MNNQHGEIISYLNIGGVYFMLKDYEIALNYYNKALEISRQLKSIRIEAKALNNIASIYATKKNMKKLSIHSILF